MLGRLTCPGFMTCTDYPGRASRQAANTTALWLANYSRSFNFLMLRFEANKSARQCAPR